MDEPAFPQSFPRYIDYAPRMFHFPSARRRGSDNPPDFTKYLLANAVSSIFLALIFPACAQRCGLVQDTSGLLWQGARIHAAVPPWTGSAGGPMGSRSGSVAACGLRRV